MFICSSNSVLDGHDPAIVATRIFFHEDGAALLNVAALLGGPTAHRRCLGLLSLLSESRSLTRALRHELFWLYRLISLDFAGNPEAGETGCFAMIDPLDPRIEEVCLLADHLYNLLVAIADLDPDCDVILGELFDLSTA
ncbi:hypothetical protein [Sagittula sp. S175]|uniref:hypothetical protein n=1 Tax=Sagittula sp. S175 TaxID=3415129 RepID=UPI003C7D5524